MNKGRVSNFSLFTFFLLHTIKPENNYEKEPSLSSTQNKFFRNTCSLSNGSGEEPVLPENVNANANSGSIKYAQRLEMPKLSTSNSDAKFITYTTTYQGKEVVTFSLELDTKKRHANWVAFTFDPTTRTDNNAGRTDKYIQIFVRKS